MKDLASDVLGKIIEVQSDMSSVDHTQLQRRIEQLSVGKIKIII